MSKFLKLYKPYIANIITNPTKILPILESISKIQSPDFTLIHFQKYCGNPPSSQLRIHRCFTHESIVIVLDAHTPILRRVTSWSRVRGRSIPRIPSFRSLHDVLTKESSIESSSCIGDRGHGPTINHAWDASEPTSLDPRRGLPLFRGQAKWPVFQVSRRESTPYLSVPRPRLGALLTKGRSGCHSR